MAEKVYDQEFNGYRREPNISTLSTDSGVYAVYRCKFNMEKKTVTLVQLIYIGKADNLNDRINNHEDWDQWHQELKKGEQICFSFTFVDKSNNERVEATLINSNKPKLNIEYKNAFPFDKTTVNCSGKHEFIKKVNVVNRH